MNISNLFEAQAKLDAHINEQHPIKTGEDRLIDKVLSLQAELMELANEWRGFKFWSNDRQPRKTLACEICEGGENELNCKHCRGTGVQAGVNPLLEEYVDCVHFIISIGLDLKVNPSELFIPVSSQKVSSEMFLSITNDVLVLDLKRTVTHYIYTFARIMELGLALGFTVEEIQHAYYSKNEINHQRQENHY